MRYTESNTVHVLRGAAILGEYMANEAHVIDRMGSLVGTIGTMVAVTDGSYIRELYPTLCSVAFILKCSKGHGRVVGSFSEALLVANAYLGELLGLMAIHLILLSINKILQNLGGSVEIVSDCLGALKQVTSLPPYCIP
jgi:hypothetical protein